MNNADQKNVRGHEKAPAAIPTDPVHTAYFYYLDYRGGGSPTVAAYELFSGIDVSLSDDEVEVATPLAVNAVSNGRNPPKYATNIKDLMRKRKGYFMIAVEGGDFDDTKPIEFKGTETSNANDAHYRDNNGSHTFEFLSVFPVKVGATRTLSVATYLCTMQHRQDRRNLEKGEWEDYQLEFFFTGGLIAPIEEGGTNLGPPPPPPGVLHLKQ